jgi:AcrR family transcriptional regulator
MGERAVQLDRTRERIVAAAVKLHAARGVQATSWDDLAMAAGVNRTTVYRHFPRLEELIPACARSAFEAIDLPSRSELELRFRDLAGPEARLERVIRESCSCYERGAGWLRAARREADMMPELARVNRKIRAGVRALVDVALGAHPIAPSARTALETVVDYPFWQELIDSGIPPAQAPGIVSQLAKSLVKARRTHEGNDSASVRPARRHR